MSKKAYKKSRSLSTLMEGVNSLRASDPEMEKNFFIHSSSNDFNNRRQNVFGSLDSLEADHVEYQKDHPSLVVENDDDNEDEMSADDARGIPISKQQVSEDFKRPICIPKKHAGRPDYFLRDPSKWTKYSLSDVRADELSDKSNMAAAMDFLQGCRKRKRENRAQESLPMELGECSGDSVSSSPNNQKPSRIVFKQGNESNKDPSSPMKVTTQHQSGKWVMPEYVIGQKTTKMKKSSVVKSNDVEQPSKSAIQLPHLDCADVEQDDSTSNTPATSNPEIVDPQLCAKTKRMFRRRPNLEDE